MRSYVITCFPDTHFQYLFQMIECLECLTQAHTGIMLTQLPEPIVNYRFPRYPYHLLCIYLYIGGTVMPHPRRWIFYVTAERSQQAELWHMSHAVSMARVLPQQIQGIEHV